jgi:Tol biopolymer transport system component
VSRLKSTAGGTYPHIARRGFTDSKATDVTPRGPFQFAASFTPDGQTRFYVHEDAHSQGDILRIDMKTRKSSAVLTGNASQIDPAVSPDGKWLTFSSDGAGEMEVYLMNLAGETRPIRLSRNGSRSPQWRADGREIVYRTSGGTLISAVPGPSGQ